MLPVSALNIMHTIKLPRAKKIVEKFSFSKLKIEKVNFFTQSPITKVFCINVFNVGSYLASCLTFRPFLTFKPIATWLLIKKNEMKINIFSGNNNLFSSLTVVWVDRSRFL